MVNKTNNEPLSLTIMTNSGAVSIVIDTKSNKILSSVQIELKGLISIPAYLNIFKKLSDFNSAVIGSISRTISFFVVVQ
ncbi:hypothetical protein BpHYR1_016752 [Brachionus plicatilis]|uniref:Uncharacterized protein n=1 Tax=Brachionus plicatilis TaxID=10195 RepID=A0A3M7Q2D9_BRAPC|nr:hypothetical protein BpHYR1_016752 [Brachionus plicatilis]